MSRGFFRNFEFFLVRRVSGEIFSLSKRECNAGGNQDARQRPGKCVTEHAMETGE